LADVAKELVASEVLLTYVVWSVHEYGAFRGDASRIKEGICVSSKVKRLLIACISELVHRESSDEASPRKKVSYNTKAAKRYSRKINTNVICF